MSAERKKLLNVENLTVRFGSRRHPFTAVNGVFTFMGWRDLNLRL